MYLRLPGFRERQKISCDDQQLAVNFWSSRWGQDAAQRLVRDPYALVMEFLTANRELGGMEASWEACDGLAKLLRYVERERPFCFVTERKTLLCA